MSAPALRPLDTIASQAAFRVLLDALARPGLVLELPVPPMAPVTVLPLALVDHTQAIVAVGPDPAVACAVASTLARATGASVARDIGEADIVVVLGAGEPSVLRALRRGSALQPERGARLGLRAAGLRADGPADVVLTLSGPGVAGTRRLGVDGIAGGLFLALAEVNGSFPAGVDTWLVDDGGQVAAISRSTRLRVEGRA